MREIRFRAWINKLSKWADGCMVNGEGGFVAYYNGVEYYDAELEQFTGLRDKNGREIYEGDILASAGKHSEGTSLAVITWCDEDAKYEAMPPGFSGRPWDLGALNPRFWEVIGNIHENPELLNEAV